VKDVLTKDEIPKPTADLIPALAHLKSHYLSSSHAVRSARKSLTLFGSEQLFKTTA
jgi:hypothetical protein